MVYNKDVDNFYREGVPDWKIYYLNIKEVKLKRI